MNQKVVVQRAGHKADHGRPLVSLAHTIRNPQLNRGIPAPNGVRRLGQLGVAGACLRFTN
jgi:hypothetical protein